MLAQREACLIAPVLALGCTIAVTMKMQGCSVLVSGLCVLYCIVLSVLYEDAGVQCTSKWLMCTVLYCTVCTI